MARQARRALLLLLSLSSVASRLDRSYVVGEVSWLATSLFSSGKANSLDSNKPRCRCPVLPPVLSLSDRGHQQHQQHLERMGWEGFRIGQRKAEHSGRAARSPRRRVCLALVWPAQLQRSVGAGGARRGGSPSGQTQQRRPWRWRRRTRGRAEVTPTSRPERVKRRQISKCSRRNGASGLQPPQWPPMTSKLGAGSS